MNQAATDCFAFLPYVVFPSDGFGSFVVDPSLSGRIPFPRVLQGPSFQVFAPPSEKPFPPGLLGLNFPEALSKTQTPFPRHFVPFLI